MSSLFLPNVMTIGSCIDVHILSHENDHIYSSRYNYQYLILNKRKTIPKGQSKSRETGNIWFTRRRKTNQNATQYVLDIIIHKQTQIT